MNPRMTRFGLPLLFLAAPAMAAETASVNPPSIATPPAAPSSGQPAGSPPASQQPKAASGENSKAPATPSLKDYCREHTC